MVFLLTSFDTVDYEILLIKLNYYGIRVITNSWFMSNLSNKKQLVSINGFDVAQGSVLGTLIQFSKNNTPIRNSTSKICYHQNNTILICL